MSIHAIKNVLQLVPEVAGHIKKACAEKEFPTDDVDSTITSALEIAFLTKVAHVAVDYEDVIRVNKAVKLYGVGDQVARHSISMVKQAQLNSVESKSINDEVKQAESIIESKTAWLTDIEKLASQSEELYDNYPDLVQSKVVQLYAGKGTLVKSAALDALNYRYKVSKNEGFVKIAEVIAATDVEKLTVEDNRSIVSSIRALEKQANCLCFDAYKDIFTMEKQAAMVDLGSKKVPVESIIRLGADRVSNILGADVAKLVEQHDVSSLVPVINSLPLPEKKLLASIV